MGLLFSKPRPDGNVVEQVGQVRQRGEEAVRVQRTPIKRRRVEKKQRDENRARPPPTRSDQLQAHESTLDTDQASANILVDDVANEPPLRDLQHEVPKRKRKKRKVAVFLGYIGEHYYGMQMNPGVITIEQVLLTAFHRAGVISEANKDSLSKIHWMRAARTDKGVSAAGQCVSAKLECEVGDSIDPTLTDAINRELPEDVLVYGMIKTTSGFSARSDCHRRRYEYMFPVRLLGGRNGTEDEVEQGKGDPRVAKLTSILKIYEGTHCFANFTDGLDGSDAAAKRYMIRVGCGQPFLPPNSGVYYVTVEVYGQSFLLHQIRKMVGLALFVYLGHAPSETIAVALSANVKIATPMAPALGLLLDSLIFENYNARFGSTLGHQISVDAFGQSKEIFKAERIYKKIAERERMERVLETWVRTCHQKMQYKKDDIADMHAKFVLTDVGREEQRKAYTASLYPIKTKLADFVHPADDKSIRLACSLRAKFEEEYGVKPTFLARAPGRVILIGEHLDYNGLPVIGAALSQGTMIAGCLDSSDYIEVKHFESGTYRDGQLRSNGARMATRETKEHLESRKDANWIQYVSWGIKALVQNLNLNKRSSPGGGRLLVGGDLPRAAGLGSSSSLVTASALAAARLNRKRFPRQQLALLSAEGERVGAGTRGGAVDHMLSMCGVRGSALRVAFSPHIGLAQLKLPEGASLFAIGCGVKAEKGFDDYVKTEFNLRAAECRIGAALIARRLDVHLSKSVTTPGQLLFQTGKTSKLKAKTISELKEKASTVLESEEVVSAQQAKDELAISEIELQNRFLLGATAETFQVGKRMTHVFSEAERVARFEAVIQSGNTNGEEVLKQLGDILNEGHVSLRELYESSCAEADELVAFCLQSGALGSRLTGAGWGGYTINLVASNIAETFVRKVIERVGDTAVEEVSMASGACIFAIHSSYGRPRE